MDKEARALRSAIQTFVRRFGLLDQTQTPCGVRLPLSHAHALMELLRTPDLTQQDLAEKLGLSKSNISRLVDRLVATGRVSRQRDAEDGRACRLALTEKGMRIAGQLDERSIGHHRALLANIPSRERAKVLQSLTLLAACCGGQERKGDG